MTTRVQVQAHSRVEYVDGREAGVEDWFVTLRPGWQFEPGDPGSHAYGFTTLREALAAVKAAQPCNCEECRKEGEQP